MNGIRLIAAGMAMLVAVGACSGSAAPTPAPATPTAAATSVATPAASATAAATVAATATPTTGPAASPAAVEVSFKSGDLTLRGFIWKPEGPGPFPALLWNHGSEKLPGQLPENAATLLAAGYVFFVPHRRGQGRSPGN